ncbi:hypothetical protein [Peterkaempfera griseoplana]|uniref:hypothetical protein n=1 Tax=Peterkaempfera griseoplana TaxID=66896 RepID=UPI0006E2F43D|nr:hypothetical protein [Peterkaempfera griseoplana]
MTTESHTEAPATEPTRTVWDGSGHHTDPRALAVAAWLVRNGIEPQDIPADVPITIRDGEILYTVHLRGPDGRYQPAAARRRTPLTHPWTGTP